MFKVSVVILRLDPRLMSFTEMLNAYFAFPLNKSFVNCVHVVLT